MTARPAGVLAGKRVVLTNWRDPEHSLAGGAERYAWELARALADAGARVDFLTAREPGQARREQREGVRIVRTGGRFGYYPRAALHQLLHRRSIDAVIDAESGIPVFSPLVLRRRTPVFLVVHHVHLDQFGTYFPPLLAGVGRFLEGRLMSRVYRSATTLAVSESTRGEMRRRLGWTGAIGLLPNGSAAPPAGAARPAHPADTVDRVVALGRLSSHKRADLVVRAVAALSAVRPAIHLDVVGSGPGLETLQRLVRDLGVEKHVTLHGHVDEHTKHVLLSRARLHVSASDVEGWGQVVIEAAAHGVPTVARDVPGLRESVRHQTTGWLLEEPRGGSDLAAVQARLLVGIETALAELDDPERRAELAAACRSWAGRFSWPAMHERAVALVAAALHPSTPDTAVAEGGTADPTHGAPAAEGERA
jgi:glycosyltransferase involved in cell wall biosynthesis